MDIFSIIGLIPVVFFVGMLIFLTLVGAYWEVKIWLIKRDIDRKIREIDREFRRRERALSLAYRPRRRTRSVKASRTKGVRASEPPGEIVLELDLTELD